MNTVTALCRWFENSHRKLPWRVHPQPYTTWVSEVMLQQTQVATVIPYYKRFLKKFPTLLSLAKAPEQEVLNLWAGLGYYSRARNLQRGAQLICEKHGGKFPTTEKELLDVPGIGPYSAGAILSIAFNAPAPIVDGNVQRVFARYYGVRTAIELKENQKQFWIWARQWVEQSRSPRILNQALMELGALICTKAQPKCRQCPLSKSCTAQQRNLQEKIPIRLPKKKTKSLYWLGLLFENRGAIYLKQNQAGEWWKDLWTIPHLECPKGFDRDSQMNKKLAPLSHIIGTIPIGSVRHTVTHHKIFVTTYLCRTHLRKLPPFVSTQGKWIPRKRLGEYPLASLTRKIINTL